MSHSEDDVVDVLLTQHARIEDLFRQVLLPRGQDRRPAFEELTRLLAARETAEKEIVHPTGHQRVDAGDAVVDDRLAEEHDAKEVPAQLQDLDPGDPAFDSKFRQLRVAVLEHAGSAPRRRGPGTQRHARIAGAAGGQG